MIRKLDERTLIAGQIDPAEIAALAQGGVTMIVNNRPDGEDPGQPSGAEIEQAAHACGIQYRHVPVGSSGLSHDQVQAMADAMESTGGTTLAFCRSGTRSIYLWALARAGAGADVEDIGRKAAEAGFDLTPITPYLG
jgi:uncharacterized protein (TIGR01244 family)